MGYGLIKHKLEAVASIPDARRYQVLAKAGSHNFGEKPLSVPHRNRQPLGPIFVIPGPTSYASAADNVERTHLVN
jgi:hypothetical protein